MDYEGFVPTPDWLIMAKLEMAEIDPGDTFFDLGCGNGRVLVLAAQNYSVRSVGIEIQADLAAVAQAAAREHQLENLIEVRQGDYLDSDLAEADVVVVYLNRGSLGQLSAKLETDLRPGTRIVTHHFDLPGWSAEHQLEILSPAGNQETLFRYRKSEA